MNRSEIKAFLHCARCLEERLPQVSMRDWSRIEVGWTRRGLQLWCSRHEKNILHIDFLNQKVGVAEEK